LLFRPTDLTMLSFHDEVSFFITIQILFDPLIDHGGYKEDVIISWKCILFLSWYSYKTTKSKKCIHYYV